MPRILPQQFRIVVQACVILVATFHNCKAFLSSSSSSSSSSWSSALPSDVRRQHRSLIVSCRLSSTKDDSSSYGSTECSKSLVSSSPVSISSSSTSTHTTKLPDTSKPLHPHTFAGMVERGMIEKFGGSKQQHEEQKEEYTNIERIITSWRLLEQDYEHKEYVGPQPNNNNNNVESSNCHQHCHSYVPGLSVQQFWDPLKERSPLVSWAEPLQQRYEEILHEFQQVALQNPEALHERGNNIWAGALTEDASSYGADWKTLVLCDRGIWDPVNVHLFPRTATAIHECGVPATEVFFASMKPHSVIQPHSDFTNFVLTSHLPLIVPESGNNKCRLTIGDETRQWLNGKLMVFDTSILHDAVNDSDETRYILMMRIWHPELSETERHALQYIYDCLNVPDLVSPDEGERFLAERRVEAMHSFPHLAATMKAVGGEGLTEFGRGKKKKKSKDQKRGKISSSSAAAKGFGK